jgi:predicted NBD/HSP70 family sugar kinase
MNQHRQHIIHLIRTHGQVARPFVAKDMSVSLPTVTNIVKGLIADGIVMEDGFSESQGGRRAALLKLDPSYAQAIGVEISHAGVKAVLMDVSGGVLETATASADTSSPDEAMRHVTEAVGSLVAKSSRERLKGIGVGVAGIVDRERGVSIKFPHSEAWTNVPVAAMLRERFGFDVLVDNDVEAATLAEFRYGAARGVDSFLYFHMGYGIRLGVVIGGKVYHGVHGRAGEMGHIVVEENGPLCYCGNNGCLESYASPRAIVAQAKEAMQKGVESSIASFAGGDASAVTIDAVLSAAAAGDRLAGNLIERVGTHIGRVMANLANLLDPTLFVLAGRLTASESPLAESVSRAFRRIATPAARDSVEIRRTAFPEGPCARGAATLVFDRMFEQLMLG